jgi:hypothetical protein
VFRGYQLEDVQTEGELQDKGIYLYFALAVF